MVKGVEKHSHCVICGKVTSSEENFCSKECEKKFEEQQKSAEKRRKIFIFLISIFAGLIVILSLIFR